MVILWYELKTKVSFCQFDQIMSQDGVNTSFIILKKEISSNALHCKIMYSDV